MYKHKHTGYIAKEKETNYEIYTESGHFVCKLDKRMVEQNPDRSLLDNQD